MALVDQIEVRILVVHRQIFLDDGVERGRKLGERA